MELSPEIKKGFTFNHDGIFSKLRELDVKVANDIDLSLVTIASLAAHLSSVISEHELIELDDQWRSLRLSANKVAIATEY